MRAASSADTEGGIAHLTSSAGPPVQVATPLARVDLALVGEHGDQLLGEQGVAARGVNDAALDYLGQVVLVHEADGGGII